METASLIQTHRFLIAQGNHGSLLGYETATKLKLIDVVHTATYKDKCREKYPGLFNDIGRLKDIQVKLHVDKTVKPKAITNRRTPFHLRSKVETELKRLEQQDIIERVLGEPTPWVSPIVTPPKKDGSIRLCVDMREPNKAILRERHSTPTVNELIHDLNGALVFSKPRTKFAIHYYVPHTHGALSL